MESQEFIVLYTHQKMKKSKVWQDGILRITHLGNKVKPGDDLESDRYLITVEEVKVAGAIGIVKQNVNKQAPELNSRTFISSGRSLGCQPSGLKRKFTGFQGPRQVPKKMVMTESGESAASHEAKKTGPTIFSPFYSMPPLFPTIGKKDVNNILADPENIVTYKNRERNAMDFSSVFSPSFQINPEVLCEENYFCSPVNTGNKLSDSLLTNEPVKRDSLASHYSGVSQNIRSKAQILALLKSESSSSCEELDSEMTEHFPQKQSQGSLKIATKPKYLIQQEECAEMKSTENLYYQHQSENTMRNKSRWAMYLSSQSSPIHSSTIDGNDTERKPKAQEDDINSNLKDLSLQKNIQFFETCAEERKKYNVDKSVSNNDQSWNQEVKLEIPSFNESSSLQVTCSSAENDGILSESDIQENNKIPFNQNDKGCVKGSVLIKENAQDVNTCGTPEKEYEQSQSSLPELKHLQIESSNNSRISDDITDMISESKMDNESLNSIHESLINVTQPFLEVTFNLNNFETSDTEEESQESNKISQDSESWVKDILVNDGNSCFQKRSENTNCEEIEGEHLPFLISVSDKPTVTFPVKETLPSQFCDKTYVGFDMGICKAENMGKEIEEYSDTLSNFESLKWTDDVYIDNKEDANKPIQEVRINYDFALPPNKSKGINMNLHIPHIQNQIAENSNLFSEDAQPQPFILGSDLDKNDEHVLPSTSSSDNSVQLLNTNQNHYECIALDKSNTHISNSLFYPLGKKHLISKDREARISEPEDLGKIGSPPPDHVEVETAREGKQCWNPRNSSELSGLVNTISILKSLSEHRTALDSLEILKKKNTVFQQGTQQTNEPDSPEGMKKSHSLENENLQRLSLLSRTQFPLITLPPTDGPPDLDSHSYMINSNTYESSGSPMLNLREKSAVLSFSIEPEDQNETSFSEESREVTPGDASLLNNISTQSKWLKYQNTSQCSIATPNRVDKRITDGFFAEAVSGMHFRDTSKRQSDAVNESSLDSVHLQMIKGMLYQQQQDFSSQDLVSRKKVLSLNLKQTSKTEEVKNVLGGSTCYNYSVKDLQEISGSELCFPSGQKIKSAYLPQRQIHIPAVFQSPAHYKRTFASCLIEHLNILLFGLAQNLHKALSKVDISFYTSLKGEKLKNVENNVPSCHHSQPAKLVMVKKEGPNKGRLFYTCDGPKADRCKFFKWLEDVTPGYSRQEGAQPGMVLSDIKSIGLYLRSQKIPLYEECQLLVRKGFDFQRKQYGKLKKFTTVNPEFYNEPKTKLYLKLSRKESSSAYSKNDLWVVSKTLDFELDTFIACSAFFGPSSINEIEILPLKGYFPSNWPTNMVVHALLVCNASTELTTLKNIQDYFNPATLPLTQYLLTTSSPTIVSNKRVSKRKFIPPAFTNVSTKFELLSLGATLKLASELIQVHKLNKDQATALIQIAQMMASRESIEEVKELQTHTLPITIIHGVFGAGKSYLLAVVILFFVQLFEKSEAPTIGNARPWKLLISSSTNVAVDRVLLGLLSLGFENFIRVGSVRKIAKPILPYSLHAGSENESEQLKELHALMKEDLTPTERVYVRKSIEQHKLGTNRTLLKQVRVVGVTCAACPFPCMNDLKFPVVVLDECSQITEPASLLPIARFECEKLILVGDPKQLPPTIQGSDAAHENGLEQTLFDRLCLMGHKPILLRTQYRCHPAISAIANDLFYKGSLMNGVTEIERSPLLEWLPTLCFYNVKGLEQIERDNSFHNVAEATFTLKLIQSLIASGIAGSMIGVITLYKSQMYKLCHLLSAVDFHHPDIKTVQVSTVDAFQGAEKEIIILSCVRTRQVGFIDSEKRMNVALTRGKRHLLIVGNLACLRKNRLWGRVIQHCEGREDGLQHANQYEPQLNHLLKDYFEKQAEEKQKKKSEKEKSKDKSHSQKDMV
ncbi:ZGRF1 isoform 9 [Pongo abelii]|uniref:5'-3' DNA helicase ZGRF1 n=1 Tax=Pongo abelii TaxID=9601 RepID=A0A2J8XQ47_PONAB|nr:ZGRF1 isoform 9 [Pongo abelii]